MTPAAVLWDLDGTLLDSEKLWDIPLYEYAEKLGGVLSLETRERMVGTNVPTTMRRISLAWRLVSRKRASMRSRSCSCPLASKVVG